MVLFCVSNGLRRRSCKISARLRTIHPNPGPRDKTEEGKKARRERRYKRRSEKREERNRNEEGREEEFLEVVTWNVQCLSIGTNNKRRLKAVANYAAKSKGM